jgi:hypothetical protein
VNSARKRRRIDDSASPSVAARDIVMSAGHTGLFAPPETDVKRILNDPADTSGRTADASRRAGGGADGGESDRHHGRRRGAADMRLTRADWLMIATTVALALLMGYLAYHGWPPEVL